MSDTVPITVAHGDGIGPEIMQATLKILEAAGARLAIETIEIGERVYKRGVSAGIEASSWESLRRTKVFLKAPITTPQGGGFKSLNVTVRKSLAMFANVRPCVAYHPFVETRHAGMDVVIVRENEEDLYAGIEHRQTDEVVQCLKVISRPGCERIVRYAFEYARLNGRKKVTCFSKDNIMKMTDGLFHRIFDEIAKDYPEITTDHWIIDIGAAKLADAPQLFDVIVTENLYGDIISDIAAEVAGSVGLGGSANIGEGCAMFEAIHGSAPTIAGRDIANPSGLLLAAIVMLVHIGQAEAAQNIHNAWLRTLEDGQHTADMYSTKSSFHLVGTQGFADEVIQRLGQEPQNFRPISYALDAPRMVLPSVTRGKAADKKIVGVDVFVHWRESGPAALAGRLKVVAADGLALSSITNRGVVVWPEGQPGTFCTDHWCCRFLAPQGASIDHRQVLALLGKVADAGLDFIKTENLCTFDGERGYALGQGE